jgi:hypothetical protein
MKPRKRRATKGIRIEPRESYDRAVIGVSKDGRLIYSYWKLIDVTLDLYFEDQTQRSIDDAVDWVDYNICGLNDSKGTMFKLSYRR